MDTLTHALSGALMARATASKPKADALPLGRRIFIGALTAAFPDIDFITQYLSPLSYLYNHRGITHSLLLLPLWAVLLSVIFALLWRGRPSWRAYLGITALGIAAHIAGDLITSFGTMIFAPLSDARYALSFTFIIDLWFTGIILAGLIACALWRKSRAPAVAGMAVLVCYVGFQGLMQQRAIEFGEQYAATNAIQSARVTAMPRPVSPFNWTIFVEDAQEFRYAHVNLIRKEPRPAEDASGGFVARLDAPYRPLADARWMRAARYGERDPQQAFAREAYGQPAFAFFRWFAAYPALLDVDLGNPAACAWFHDLRFDTPGRGATPFRYGMCRKEDGRWSPYQLVGRERRPVY
jgi:inner membrane protein